MQDTFPIFRSLSKKDFPRFLDISRSLPQHIDFTLNGVYVWLSGRNDYNIDISWLNGNIVLKIMDCALLNNNSPAYTVIGNTSPDETLLELLQNTTVDIKELVMVPDFFVENIKQTNLFHISEEVNHRDYILDVNSLVSKKGSLYEDFRHNINYVLKNYSDGMILKDMDLSNAGHLKEVVNAMHSWTNIRSFSAGGNDPDKLDAWAINRLLNLSSTLPISYKCLGVHIGDTLKGFSIYHIPNPKGEIAMGNHIKCSSAYNRLFDFLVWITAIRLKEMGIKLINVDQDMGNPGVKSYKSKLNPVKFYKKYSIKLK